MNIKHVSLLLIIIILAPAGGLGFDSTSIRADGSMAQDLEWRLLGPAHMSGRITDIAVSRFDKHTIYCATATGGIWKTVNNGTTWKPIFDHQQTSSIGDIALSNSEPNILWAGTGEANASSYSSWGHGVYKSINGGETWAYMGLKNTHHIGRVIIHPSDPDIVYVAALGHLWGPNKERGLFQTKNGGKNWEKINDINADVGFVDIAMDPKNSEILYAASYGRRADRFDDFDSLGITVIEGSTLYKSTDSGKNWKKILSGLPKDRVGRIGLALSLSSPHVLYSIIERAPYPIFLETPVIEKIKRLLRSSQPQKNDVEEIRKIIERGTPTEEIPAAVIQGLSRQQQLQLRVLIGHGELDTGGGIFRSENRGESWNRVSNLNERASYYSQIRIDPKDENHVYVLLVRTWESKDGGKTFGQKGWAFSSYLTSSYIHGDFHAMWIDPDDPDHLIVGSDGGLFTSYDGGHAWEAHPMPLGQFVSVAVDNRNPYFIYGGLQDNGTWGGPSQTRHVSGISDADWFKLITGDGGVVQVDPTDHRRIYAESQYGALSRVDLKTGERVNIRPSGREVGKALRFNYVAPFIISPHDPDTIYLGAQVVLKSTNNGKDWKAISPDLTKNEPVPKTFEGATITSISESYVNPGTLYAGTDDGNVYLTRNDGKTWLNLSDRIQGIPKDQKGSPKIWVSRIETSHFQTGRVYISFDGHRDDDFGVYLYATDDFGESWSSIKGDLPYGAPVNVVREDPKNKNLLYVGTETGVFCTLDRGAHWTRMNNGFPTVPVDDLLVHPKYADLVAATHGRGIYILDIYPLQQLSQEAMNAEVFLFDPEPATFYYVDWTKNKGASGARRFSANNPYSHLTQMGDRSGMAPPGATIYYLLKRDPQNPVKITIFDKAGKRVRELKATSEKGINRLDWDLRENPLPLPPSWQRLGSNDSRQLQKLGPPMQPGQMIRPGLYRIQLLCDEMKIEKNILVKGDNLLH